MDYTVFLVKILNYVAYKKEQISFISYTQF